jgi:signal transduction histidine kinase
MGVALLVVVIGLIIIASNFLYKRTVALLTNNLRDAITTISVTEATNISADDLAQLHTEEDWKKPEWQRVVTQLHNAKYANKNVVFMYIFRKKANDPTQMEYVADADSLNPFANDVLLPEGTDSIATTACGSCVDVNRDGVIEPDGPDKLQWPGQEYIDPPSETFQAYTGPLTSKDIYTDSYGSVLTGYAPIKDANGNTVAILGTDIKANDFLTITTQTLLPFLIFILFLALTISGLTIGILIIWRRYAGSLENLNNKISLTNEKLQGLDKLKTEFLSLASHQLRSPLTAIKGYSSMLTEGSFGALTDKIREPITRIYASAQGLVSIVEDLLNVSKIEQGGMKYEFMATDLAPIIQNLYNEMQMPAQGKHITFSLDMKPGEKFMANVDPIKIKQIFLNLTDNSIKYTPEYGVVTLSIKHINSTILFAVTDNGIGISPETKNKLFEKFSRGEGGRINTGGSGLGLYLAREIARAHNGDVRIESEGLGKGSTFTVSIPGIEG